MSLKFIQLPSIQPNIARKKAEHIAMRIEAARLESIKTMRELWDLTWEHDDIQELFNELDAQGVNILIAGGLMRDYLANIATALGTDFATMVGEKYASAKLPYEIVNGKVIIQEVQETVEGKVGGRGR